MNSNDQSDLQISQCIWNTIEELVQRERRRDHNGFKCVIWCALGAERNLRQQSIASREQQGRSICVGRNVLSNALGMVVAFSQAYILSTFNHICYVDRTVIFVLVCLDAYVNTGALGVRQLRSKNLSIQTLNIS